MSTKPIFGAQLLRLPEIFESRLFTVPDYQRAYAWDDRQVQELLKDLDHLLDDDAVHCHYTGTLVLSRPSTNEPPEYHVVDGQQRLTTLVIILCALASYLPDEDKPNFRALYLERGEFGSDRSVLRLNSDTRQFFERVVLKDGNAHNEPMSLEAHARLLKARTLIYDWIQERIKTGTTVEQLRATIECELGFLVYTPKEDVETGVMFEVINNRGKALSELEKVKNYLIYCSVKLGAHSIRENIDESWSKILRDLNIAKKTSPGDEGAFLRYCMVVYFKLNKTDSQYGYDELKKRLVPGDCIRDPSRKIGLLTQISSFVGFLKLASLWYSRLYGRRHEGIERNVVSLLEQIRSQDRHASIMPLFFAIVMRNDGAGPKLVRLLSLLERLNFRFYMARNVATRSDSGQGELYTYAADYFHNQLHQKMPVEEREIGKIVLEDDHQALEHKLLSFVLSYASDAVLKSSLELERESNDDFYRWGGLRYFLMCYEQDLQPNKTIRIDKITMARSEGKSADYLSVEHRWATENRNLEGENNRAVDRFEKRRLGNFTLLELRLNIQASNTSLEAKLENYLGKGSEPPTDLEQVRKMARSAKNALARFSTLNRSKNYYLGLHKEINDEIERDLVKFALKRWSVDEFIGYSELKKRIDEE